MQRSVIQSLEPQLMLFIKQRLQNGHINMHITQAEHPEVQAYTTEKRYQLLAQKNPAVSELKDKLNLILE